MCPATTGTAHKQLLLAKDHVMHKTISAMLCSLLDAVCMVVFYTEITAVQLQALLQGISDYHF